MEQAEQKHPLKKWFKENLGTLLFIILVVVVLEFSLFNLRYWATAGVGPSSNAVDYTIDLGEEIAVASKMTFRPTAAGAAMTILDIGQNIRTVRIVPDFGDTDIKQAKFDLIYRDENQEHKYTAQILNGYQNSYYIPLGAMGKVDSLTVTFGNENVGIKEIVFNTPLPWTFNGLRVFLTVFAITAIFYWKKYNFGSVLFDPQLAWQKWLDAGIVALYIFLLIFVVVFSVDFGYIPGSGRELKWNPPNNNTDRIYDYMVDAVLLGQLHMDMQPDESLVNAASPYNDTYRRENDIQTPWDYVYYNGKFYSSFGITPVFVLFLPYYIILGKYLSATTATAVFCVLGALGLYFFWRELAKKYLPKTTYVTYLASLLAVMFGSNLLLLAARPLNYEVPVSCGFMFSAWGLFFVLRSVGGDSLDQLKTVSLFAGALCLALAVGCRLSDVFFSLLVPVMLLPVLKSLSPFREKWRDKQFRKTLLVKILVLAIPYLVIGISLMWFNYARFGSVTESGITYQISNENVGAATESGLLGNIRREYDGLFGYLFTMFAVSPYFPFVSAGDAKAVFTGFEVRQALIGVFALPVSWFLFAIFYISKNEAFKNVARIIAGMVVVSLTIILVSSAIAINVRYTVDFFWLMIIAANLCAGLLYMQARRKRKDYAAFIGKLHLAAALLSCAILFGWDLVGENNYILNQNPVVIRYLSDMLTIL
ncbi:MAG: hypothetical protein LBI54_00525 [Lachnospiraceae bacterium]|jgi:hypothetical protein|nr:hypothetical protein [Lachnospiraceae bacterium]